MEILIGNYKIAEKTVFSKNYESHKYFTRIEVEPCEVPVFRFNNDAYYKVSGKIIADDTISQVGKIEEAVAQPYAYRMIKDINFTPNAQFFVEFPQLKK